MTLPAFLTKFHEIESYIHPSLYGVAYQSSTPFLDLETPDWKSGWQEKDIPKELSKFLKAQYNSGDRHLKHYSADEIKSCFCENLSKEMTKDLLIDLGAYNEMNGWFDFIKSKLVPTEESGT